MLRAFAAGSVALTGTEAVSNGVQAFRPPEARNAGMVLILMGGLFATIFIGISFLASQLGVIPDHERAGDGDQPDRPDPVRGRHPRSIT